MDYTHTQIHIEVTRNALVHPRGYNRSTSAFSSSQHPLPKGIEADIDVELDAATINSHRTHDRLHRASTETEFSARVPKISQTSSYAKTARTPKTQHPDGLLHPPTRLGIILVIEQRNYSHISSYVFKAEGALDTASAAAASNAASCSNNISAAPPPKKSAERDQVQSKLDFAMALFQLGQADYKKAPRLFLKIGPPDWTGKLVAPGDFTVYGTLCALVSMLRSSIKSQLTGNAVFSAYIEQEPYVRDLTQSYLSSDFKNVLKLLERYSIYFLYL
ncbi:hypothetical protein DFJ58DRAFT_741770 [Suillus subalutaceus]|uniref:uncharacterized protein n=1 Tax=Suillus subalutaceus TaxID=48586 RepID=UPI001B8741FB|nr:uncharacterized protein DFJ58DRAFT_741770 [Suillus subalutaceus]KAG1872347.1 hypothetical protein DFJ58DRAFT_741770 [Suillus subalutaceus]